ncbi:alpha/beta hydrolase [Rhodobacteraceae bacterium N5(2021)]|uniref:Alpha/beta hydrolase n=1 Tax=Gymnodinialimonas phycosphaerae TaxID=2841589 RepID=A0A975TWG0_9RHOB|nr:alpha/beta hydrolase [Gymnodinialimonas phycosphaerae]MBY4891942.1 alpha/beta hydrolase [Gymnodinialimonas phycosphaerae]
MKTVFKLSMGVFLIAVAIVGLLMVATRGDYRVLPLVIDDPALPSRVIAGINLHLRIVEGPPDTTTVIVLHGGPGGDFRSLQGLDALSDDYRIVYYDQRGAGLSQRVESDHLTLEGHVTELAGVIDHVSPHANPVLIGHSWGAILATSYLGRYPERIAGVVLIEPGFLNAAGRERWEERSRDYMSGLTYWREAVLTGFRAQHVDGPDLSAPDDFLIGHMVDVFVNHPHNPYHCGQGYTAPSWRFGAASSDILEAISPRDLDDIAERAADFSGHVMLMAGACNSWTGPELQRLHQSHFNDAEVVVVNDAGHNVIWDNPGVSLTAIRGFLSGITTH